MPLRHAHAFQCKTATGLSRRLPAILEVENTCATQQLALCLEYAASNFLSRSVKPSTVETMSTALHDCWILRASDCQGPILLQHHVTGTRKLSIGCAAVDPDTYALLHKRTVSLQCTMTVVPSLRDAFNAALQYLAPADVPAIDARTYASIYEPITTLSRTDLLSSVYALSVMLARHGVHVDTALVLFEHAQALVEYMERCHPHLIGSSISLPQAYLAVYGTTVARMQAAAIDANTWIVTIPPLTASQKVELSGLQTLATTGLPLAAVKPPESLLQHRTSRMLVMPTKMPTPIKSASPSRSPSAKRMSSLSIPAVRTISQEEGQAFCDTDGVNKWKFWRLTRSDSGVKRIDCCSLGCLLFYEVSTGMSFSKQSFSANCCLMCNWGVGCTQKLTSHSRAILEMAEIQKPTLSVSHSSRAIRVII